MYPLAQVRLLTVTAPSPDKVPPLKWNVPTLASALKVTVPARVKVSTLTGTLKLAVPLTDKLGTSRSGLSNWTAP